MVDTGGSIHQEEGRTLGGRRKAVRGCAKNQERDYKELQDIIGYTNAKLSRLLAAMERMQKLRSEAPEEIQMSVLQDVMVLHYKISEVEEKQLQASEEMRTLRAKRRKVEVEE